MIKLSVERYIISFDAAISSARRQILFLTTVIHAWECRADIKRENGY